MTAAVFVGLFCAGLAVGLLSGLIGIGGGVLIVPLLYFFYAAPEWSGTAVPSDLQATLAHATSLAVIVPTAVRGALTYHRSGLVAWRAALPIAGGAVAGAVAGAMLAVHMPAVVLKMAFGVLLVLSGIQLVRGRTAGRPGRRPASRVALAAVGVSVGLLSAFLGVGGGIVAIPILIYLVRLDLDRVAGTSLAIIVFAALAGVVAYMASGWGRAGLPPGSAGYVHVIALLPIVAGSLIAVHWGALLNQRLRTRSLRWLFAALFLVMGIRLIVQNAGRLSG